MYWLLLSFCTILIVAGFMFPNWILIPIGFGIAILYDQLEETS